MNIQRTVYDPLAITFAYQEERVRRRLAVPNTQSAMWERTKRERAANQWLDEPVPGVWEANLPTNKILTAEQVREIKQVFSQPHPRGTTARLARKFQVNWKTIRDIRTGITWTRLV